MAPSFLLALLAGCDPHDATVSGTYAMYFGESTSDNIERLRLDYPPPPCAYEQTDPKIDEADIDYDKLFTDDCYLQKVEIEERFQKDWGLSVVDCRNLEDYNGIELRDAIVPGWEEEYKNYCCEEAFDDDDSNDPEGTIAPFVKDNGEIGSGFNDCTRRKPTYLGWLDDYSYYLNSGKLETYREEAVITAEGDLQLTFHVDTPFGDFRAVWVVDPDFQPTECTDVDGESTWQKIDGDWLEGWSIAEEDEGYTLFNLNAGTYQLNPSNTGDYWFFNKDWYGGAAAARFADEEFYLYSTDYADPEYTPLWVAVNDDGAVTGGYGNYGTEVFTELNCDIDAGDSCHDYADYADFVQMLRDNMTTGGPDRDDNDVRPADMELENYGRLAHEEFGWHIKVEDNSWRPTAVGEGDRAEGFDGWAGLNPSWVRFEAEPDTIRALEPGSLDKPLKGEFQLYLSSLSTSASQLLVTGSFEITDIERDVWGYSPTLDEIKREENDTPECGE
jgi:hypothetical protein